MCWTGEERLRETTEDYEELLTQLWRRGLESVELIVERRHCRRWSGAAQTVYPAGRGNSACAWRTGSAHLEALTPRFPWFQRRKFPPGVLVDWDAENEVQARQWARRFCARWRCAAPEMVQKFQAERHQVLAFFAFPAPWRHRCAPQSGRGLVQTLTPAT